VIAPLGVLTLALPHRFHTLKAARIYRLLRLTSCYHSKRLICRRKRHRTRIGHGKRLIHDTETEFECKQ
jgi:hypothetical protein